MSELLERITINPAVRSGKPVIRGCMKRLFDKTITLLCSQYIVIRHFAEDTIATFLPLTQPDSLFQ